MKAIRAITLACMLLAEITTLAQVDSLFPGAPENLENPSSPELTTISFVGNGDFQKAFSADAGFEANTGLGLIFARQWPKERWLQDIEIDLYVNIASTLDTLNFDLQPYQPGNSQLATGNRELGTYLLMPRNGKQGAFFNLNAYFGNKKEQAWTRFISGFHFRFQASSSVLKYSDAATNLSGIACRFGLFHDFMPDEIRREKNYSIQLGLNYSFRGLLGDLSAPEYGLVRRLALNSTKTLFHGLEIHLGFKIQNIRAEVQIPIFPSKFQVPGLTNSQFITTIGFVGGFPIAVDGYKK